MEKLRSEETCKEFQKRMNNIMDYDDMDMNLEERWNKLKTSAHNTAMEILGKPNQKHQDWFDGNDFELNSLLEKRNRLKQ